MAIILSPCVNPLIKLADNKRYIADLFFKDPNDIFFKNRIKKRVVSNNIKVGKITFVLMVTSDQINTLVGRLEALRGYL